MSVTKVVLAKLSPTMEEGTIVKWSKNEGDPVKVGDVLAEIETDKANMEMEALGTGILRKILVPAGGKAPVGALIGVIAEAGEDISAMLASAAAPAAATAPPAPLRLPLQLPPPRRQLLRPPPHLPLRPQPPSQRPHLLPRRPLPLRRRPPRPRPRSLLLRPLPPHPPPLSRPSPHLRQPPGQGTAGGSGRAPSPA